MHTPSSAVWRPTCYSWLRCYRHRHLPKPIYKAASLRRIMTDAQRKKDERRRAHSAPGSIVNKPLRKRRIIKEVEWFFVGMHYNVDTPLKNIHCKILIHLFTHICILEMNPRFAFFFMYFNCLHWYNNILLMWQRKVLV